MDLENDVLLCLCHNLRRGTRRITQFYDEALRPSKLKITQFVLLAALDRFGTTTMLPLAGFMAMDRTTLTRNLALLQRKGLVSLSEGTEDRRQQILQLTPKGRALLKAAMPRWQKAQAEALALLKRPNTLHLLRTLDTIANLPESSSI